LVWETPFLAASARSKALCLILQNNPAVGSRKVHPMNRKQRRVLARQQSSNGRRSGKPVSQSGGLSASSIGVNEQFSLALEYQRASRLVEAEALHRQVIGIEPNHFGSLYLLGILALQRGQNDVAIDFIGRALSIRPDYAEAHNNLANAFKSKGELVGAITHYERALALNPDYPEAHNNLGTALKARGELIRAVASYERALALKPDYAEALNNLGNALVDQLKVADAVACYTRALALKPAYFEAHNNLGTALMELGRPDEAIAHYERALTINPDFAEAHNNLGNVLRRQGKFDEAVARYKQALALKPEYIEGYYNLGTALQEQGAFDDALTQYERALQLNPHHAETLTSLGTLFLLRDSPEKAVAEHNRAIASEPNFAEAYNNLGVALLELGKPDEAAVCHEHALALKQNFPEAKFGLCMARLPVLYAEEQEISARRARYQKCLEALCDDVANSKSPGDFATAVGSSQPFYLSYQGRNDRDLQALYGSAVCQIMSSRYPTAPIAAPPKLPGPVRVGIVSGYFRHHSNWKIPIKGWLSQLDRERFELFGYHTGVKTDAETKLASALCNRFVQGPLPVHTWRQVILSDAPHVLIYPEVGMDPVSAQLAAQRLAPTQCNSWGHPDTSGFPTLDYYLSSDLMEPLDGQEHYTERLIRLPNLSIYYDEPDTQSIVQTREDFGLRPGATNFWCGQSLFKYLPQYDCVFPRIAREVGKCQFVFIRHQRSTHVTGMFRKRLEQSFASFGLQSDDYCFFLSRLEPERFAAAIGQCDILLDSIGWSGCNSTLESLPHDLPIVTMAGTLMRGRHGMAILKMMGVTETITETLDDYISTAVRLARDAPWRILIKSQMAQRKHMLYRDRSCISELESFLTRAADRRF
jgi:protein O-GlcNAc transferase